MRRPVGLFVRGDEYRFWGLFRTNVHLFGVGPGREMFLLGTDKLGRDLFSRIIYGGRVSLSIGLVGVALAFILGCFFGGVSGYYGGKIDLLIQRVIEFILSMPTIPLWMALSAALPPDWSPLKVYFGITIILSMVGWCGLARVVRGKLLEMREQDFTMAARLAGARDRWIITRHLLPGFMSYLIVHVTLAIPHMILAETALSFLGLGLRAPVVSWGTLLQDLRERLGLTYIFISHDLSVVEHISDRVAVMYVGKLVETAPSAELFERPRHPYTEALLSAVPRPDPRRKSRRIRLEGDVPSPANPPVGCHFHPRCRYKQERCEREAPPWEELEPGRFAACHFARELDLQGVDMLK